MNDEQAYVGLRSTPNSNIPPIHLGNYVSVSSVNI